jgi:hypothetical protein
MVRCHGEAARSVLIEVGDDVFAVFHAVSTKFCSRTRNSQFGLLGQILYTQSPPVQMAAPVQKILDQPMYCNAIKDEILVTIISC